MKKKRITRDAFHKMFPKINLTLVKDEDLEMEETSEMASEGNGGNDILEQVQGIAEEAKNAAIQAVEAAKQAAEAVEKVESGGNMEEEVIQEETPQEEIPQDEGEESISTLSAKIDALTNLVQQLVDSVTEGDGNEEALEGEAIKGEEIGQGGEEENYDENEEEIIDPDLEEEEMISDEGEDENIAEKMAESPNGLETRDAIWQDVISRAEIIAPGIIASKPDKSSNFKKVVTAVKRRALNSAMTKDHSGIIKPLLKNKAISGLTEDSLDMAFNAASILVSKANNLKIQNNKKPIQMKDLSSHNELAEMNRRNKEFWNKK